MVTVKILNKTVPGEKHHMYSETHSIVKGKCNFAGYNEALGMVSLTINRLPIFPIEETDIISVE